MDASTLSHTFNKNKQRQFNERTIKEKAASSPKKLFIARCVLLTVFKNRRGQVQDSEIYTEIEQQIWSYLDICAMYEKTPSVLGFADHLKESYER